MSKGCVSSCHHEIYYEILAQSVVHHAHRRVVRGDGFARARAGEGGAEDAGNKLSWDDNYSMGIYRDDNFYKLSDFTHYGNWNSSIYNQSRSNISNIFFF